MYLQNNNHQLSSEQKGKQQTQNAKQGAKCRNGGREPIQLVLKIRCQ